MAEKRAFPKAKTDNVFGQRRTRPKMFRAGLYARVSTNDQQTLAMQNRAMREYAVTYTAITFGPYVTVPLCRYAAMTLCRYATMPL